MRHTGVLQFSAYSKEAAADEVDENTAAVTFVSMTCRTFSKS